MASANAAAIASRARCGLVGAHHAADRMLGRALRDHRHRHAGAAQRAEQALGRARHADHAVADQFDAWPGRATRLRPFTGAPSGSLLAADQRARRCGPAACCGCTAGCRAPAPAPSSADAAPWRRSRPARRPRRSDIDGRQTASGTSRGSAESTPSTSVQIVSASASNRRRRSPRSSRCRCGRAWWRGPRASRATKPVTTTWPCAVARAPCRQALAARRPVDRHAHLARMHDQHVARVQTQPAGACRRRARRASAATTRPRPARAGPGQRHRRRRRLTRSMSSCSRRPSNSSSSARRRPWCAVAVERIGRVEVALAQRLPGRRPVLAAARAPASSAISASVTPCIAETTTMRVRAWSSSRAAADAIQRGVGEAAAAELVHVALRGERVVRHRRKAWLGLLVGPASGPGARPAHPGRVRRRGLVQLDTPVRTPKGVVPVPVVIAMATIAAARSRTGVCCVCGGMLRCVMWARKSR